MKVVILAHGHPDLSPGGAERSAYSLFQHLRTRSGVEAVFIARAEPRDIGHDGWFGAFRSRKDEFLWAPPPFDWFRCVSLQPDILRQQIEAIARRFQADVVHLHHYFHFGLDALRLFSELAASRIILTLHEYALICTHNGQMVKRDTLRLCHAASPAECSACFPETSSGKFFLRETLIKEFLGYVNTFVSPSQFLKDRYVAWGIQPEKINVIENLLPIDFRTQSAVATTRSALPRKRGKMRFGYFGQINPYKGANVLLDALRHVTPETLENIEIVIFGARLEEQPADFRMLLERQIAEGGANIAFMGPYRNADVPDLLRRVDWMVIPSIWWENSPLVILEARATGRPILASNIGGMAEKVRDGVDGLHFLAGSSMDCAGKIDDIVSGAIELAPIAIDHIEHSKRALQAHISAYESSNVRGGSLAGKYLLS